MKIEGIHVLRGLAATMVVVCHAQLTLFGSETSGASGVDIFFVISGFVMALTTAKDPSVLSFIGKRLFRIVPLYWLVLLFTVRHGGFDVRDFLFIPRLGEYGIKPILSQGWTLNFEMMFYAIFALSMVFGRWFIALGLLALPMLTTLGLTGVPATFYSDSIVLEFGLGVILYHLAQRGFPDWPRAVFLAIMALGFVVLLNGWNSGPRCLVSGLPALVIVWASFRGCEGWLSSKTLKILGDASYAIYLVHWTSFGPLKHLTGSPALLIPVHVLAGVGAGVAVHLMVEKPLTSLLHRAAAGRRMLSRKTFGVIVSDANRA